MITRMILFRPRREKVWCEDTDMLLQMSAYLNEPGSTRHGPAYARLLRKQRSVLPIHHICSTVSTDLVTIRPTKESARIRFDASV